MEECELMWYNNIGKDNDVALSSRVRLARNLAGYPFGDRLTDDKKKEITEKINGIFAPIEGWNITDFGSLSDAVRLGMADKHLVSREFAKGGEGASLISNEDNSVNIMIHEEDHIRIQAIVSGADLRGALGAAYKAEEMIDGTAELAYSEKYGYLTHCPTNLGTGMRASVMLHLPAYTEAGGIRNLALQLAKLGLTIRGMDGEGSTASAYLYQISNQVTLGVTEDEIIDRLESVIGQIITGERALREKMSKPALRERARRNYGILMYAESVTSREITEMYSTMRLASAVGEVNIPVQKLDEMLMCSMPWAVAAETVDNTPLMRDKARAEGIHRIIGGLEI